MVSMFYPYCNGFGTRTIVIFVCKNSTLTWSSPDTHWATRNFVKRPKSVFFSFCYIIETLAKSSYYFGNAPNKDVGVTTLKID